MFGHMSVSSICFQASKWVNGHLMMHEVSANLTTCSFFIPCRILPWLHLPKCFSYHVMQLTASTPAPRQIFQVVGKSSSTLADDPYTGILSSYHNPVLALSPNCSKSSCTAITVATHTANRGSLANAPVPLFRHVNSFPAVRIYVGSTGPRITSNYSPTLRFLDPLHFPHITSFFSRFW